MSATSSPIIRPFQSAEEAEDRGFGEDFDDDDDDLFGDNLNRHQQLREEGEGRAVVKMEDDDDDDPFGDFQMNDLERVPVNEAKEVNTKKEDIDKDLIVQEDSWTVVDAYFRWVLVGVFVLPVFSTRFEFIFYPPGARV